MRLHGGFHLPFCSIFCWIGIGVLTGLLLALKITKSSALAYKMIPHLHLPLIRYCRAVYPPYLNLSIENHREASQLCLACGWAHHPTWVVSTQTHTASFKIHTDLPWKPVKPVEILQGSNLNNSWLADPAIIPDLGGYLPALFMLRLHLVYPASAARFLSAALYYFAALCYSAALRQSDAPGCHS